MTPEKKKEWRTEETGIPLKTYYTAQDSGSLDPEHDLGLPGAFPYTRGIYESSYRNDAWQVRQYVGFGLPEQTNERACYMVQEGARGRGGLPVVNIITDLPTKLGYDSDHPIARYEVGRVGVAMDNIEDMEALFQGLPQDRVVANFPSYTGSVGMWCLYIALARKRGIPEEKLMGALTNTIFEAYTCCRYEIFPLLPALRLSLDFTEYATKKIRRLTVNTFSASNFYHSGGYSHQAVAWAIAEAIAYAEALTERGLAVDDFAPLFSIYCATSRDFFEEIAKYRALRRLYAREMERRFHPKNPRSTQARVATRTYGHYLSARQPVINISRSTIAALASLLGGVQSVTITPYDEALSIPSKEAMTVALKQQEIIAYESNIRSVTDPFGGSYFIEWLTDRYEEKLVEELKKVEQMGEGREYGPPMLTGMIKGTLQGYFRDAMVQAAYQKKENIDRGDWAVIGVNRSLVEEEVPVNIERADPTVREIKVKRLQEFRRRRDQAAVKRALEGLSKAAADPKVNLIEPMIQAFGAGATQGEVFRGALMKVFGEWKESAVRVS